MLLIHNSADPHARYSHYLAEILRLEGFMDADEADYEKVNATTLSAHDLVILPRLTPTMGQAEALLDYLVQGGSLIAFLPAPNLARRLGLQVLYRGIEAGYLHLDSAEPLNRGFIHDPLQIIVPAVAWAAPADNDARVLATISASRSPASGEHIPGLIEVQVGAGKAILFAYDLPHAVARLRQGDPAHADLSFGGLDGIYRPSELFVNQLAVEQMRLPQADLQTAWLARLIETMAPRPRLWYYPQAEQRSAMLMTSDDDWSSLEQFEVLIDGMKNGTPIVRSTSCRRRILPAHTWIDGSRTGTPSPSTRRRRLTSSRGWPRRKNSAISYQRCCTRMSPVIAANSIVTRAPFASTRCAGSAMWKPPTSWRNWAF
ncbi:MAG: hypothetical protein HC802_10990 [Caldilineaceae bacterium]|nr:hypothetical protein [Caldilineaceae bacterium]